MKHIHLWREILSIHNKYTVLELIKPLASFLESLQHIDSPSHLSIHYTILLVIAMMLVAWFTWMEVVGAWIDVAHGTVLWCIILYLFPELIVQYFSSS